MDQELYTSFVGSLCEASFWSTTRDSIKDLFYDADTLRRNVLTNTKNDKYSGSIARRAAGLVLVFPVLVSSSVSINTSVLISKAIERKCISLLEILFSAINITDKETVQDLYDYIAKFHTNLETPKNSISLDDFITAMQQGQHEGAISINIPQSQYDAILQELSAINTPAKTYLRESSLNDYVISKNYGNVLISEANNNNGRNNNNRHNNNNGRNNNIRNQGHVTPHNINNNNHQVHNFASPSSSSKEKPEDVRKALSSQVISNDLKKANELQPTNMIINFKIRSGENVETQSGIVGVKAKLYPIDSYEILTRISDKYTDGFLFNFIKASTGEKSFWKDLVFAFDKIKNSAIRIAKGSVNAKLFNLLERRAARGRSRFLNVGDANPITTLVITREEVEYLKKNNAIDLDKPSATNVLFNGYNLMGLVIVDDSIEAAYFLFDDGSNAYERISYELLDRETDDKNYKKIVNLLARGGRV